jgi:hypothetical protein
MLGSRAGSQFVSNTDAAKKASRSSRNNENYKSLGPTIGSAGNRIGGQQAVTGTGQELIRDQDGDGMIYDGTPQETSAPKKNVARMLPGQIEKGNINLKDRPKVRNADGSISTVRSVSFETNGSVVLVPTVIKNPDGTGKIVSNRAAWNHYRRTGEHLGKFSNQQAANRYAESLHVQQERMYANPSSKSYDARLGN